MLLALHEHAGHEAQAMIDRQVLVDRVIGLALIGLGLAVAVTGMR